MIRQIVTLGYIVIAISSVAQTTDPFEEFKRKREQEMKSFESDYKRGLDSLREAQNRDFALMLAGKWSEREVATAPPIHELPKPEIPPSVDEERPASLPTTPVVLPEIPAQPSEPAESETSSAEPETEDLPSHQVPSDSEYIEEDAYREKIEGATMGLNLTSSSFLGNATWLPQLSAWPVCSKPLNSKSIADYWKECSEKSIEAYISYLKTQRELLHLSDWALIELVKQWSTSLLNDRNDAGLFTWFILVQSGYDVRLMYTDR